MKSNPTKNPARRQTKTESLVITLPKPQNRLKPILFTPKAATLAFGNIILEPVVYNLCGWSIRLLDLTDEINEIKRIIPTLPPVKKQLALRPLYELILRRLCRERRECQKHIHFLGRCYDLLRGTRLFTPKLVKGRVDVETLKQRTNIADVISRDVELRPAGKTLKGRCPFHNDRTPSLVIYPDDGRWWCFACSEGGDVINYIQKIRQCSFREAVAELQSV